MIEFPRSPIVAIAIAFGAVLILAAACGGGKDGSDQPTATTAASETPVDGATATQITLNDWSITGEGGGPLSAQAGEVAFEIENVGAQPHEFVVIATDTDPADLPVDAGLVDEGAAGVLIGRTPLIGAGNSDVLRLELEAGTYAVICNVLTHYELGMYTSLTVE
ncbi:MAG: hypothetical protein HY723_00450 [Chloroflexi bacterium]|nr:hypothetical protein [Chloroflexota bacterium]